MSTLCCYFIGKSPFWIYSAIQFARYKCVWCVCVHVCTLDWYIHTVSTFRLIVTFFSALYVYSRYFVSSKFAMLHFRKFSFISSLITYHFNITLHYYIKCLQILLKNFGAQSFKKKQILNDKFSLKSYIYSWYICIYLGRVCDLTVQANAAHFFYYLFVAPMASLWHTEYVR